MANRLLESGSVRLLEPALSVLDDASALSETRAGIMALLAPDAENPEWTVADGIVDAFVPPGFLVTWGDGWVQPKTHCLATAALDVIVIAARFEPESGTVALEQLVEIAYGRFAAGGLVPRSVSRPGRFDIGGVAYLAAHIALDSSVSMGGPS